MFFHVWEKWYVLSEATEVCEFRAKIPAFYCSLQGRFAHIQRDLLFVWLDLGRRIWLGLGLEYFRTMFIYQSASLQSAFVAHRIWYAPWLMTYQ